MHLTLYTEKLEAYLCHSEIINFDNSDVARKSDEIASLSDSKLEYIKKTYEFVRDKISHSADINHNNVTCSASEVLREGHGICFAKSHLLAALLRCKSIPAGFCYQKLILDDETDPYLILHGLNGVYIEEFDKWIRLDARGNKSGVDAQFSLDDEKLAFPVRHEKGEEDILTVFPEPDRNILKAMRENKTRSQLWNDLPKELAYSQMI